MQAVEASANASSNALPTRVNSAGVITCCNPSNSRRSSFRMWDESWSTKLRKLLMSKVVVVARVNKSRKLKCSARSSSTRGCRLGKTAAAGNTTFSSAAKWDEIFITKHAALGREGCAPSLSNRRLSNPCSHGLGLRPVAEDRPQSEPIGANTVPFLDQHSIGLEELANLKPFPAHNIFQDGREN